MDDYFKTELSKLKNADSLRGLTSDCGGVDFYSNDYLGLAKSKELFKRSNQILEELAFNNTRENSIKNINGSTGSRLLSGQNTFVESLEKKISEFHKSEDCLIMNSGYNANLSVFSSIATRHDTILYDEFIHASIRDGIRLSNARNYSFKHNNIHDLKKRIKQASGKIFIAVESLYSMDGDLADLIQLVEISRKHGAHLIVDEAHAVGVYGETGKGLVFENNLTDKVLCRIVTFGKALGVHGACVLGSESLKQYLINKARSFIYTTSITPHTLCAISAAYDELPNADDRRLKLYSNITYFSDQSHRILGKGLTNPNAETKQNIDTTQIQSLIIPGNDKVKNLARKLIENGFEVRPIVSPTVAKESERIRITLHSFNTADQIKQLINSIQQISNE